MKKNMRRTGWEKRDQILGRMGKDFGWKTLQEKGKGGPVPNSGRQGKKR